MNRGFINFSDSFPGLPDGEVVKLALSEDPEIAAAFKTLLWRCRFTMKKVIGRARLYGNPSHSTAYDLEMAVIAAAWKGLPKYEASRSIRFATYIYSRMLAAVLIEAGLRQAIEPVERFDESVVSGVRNELSLPKGSLHAPVYAIDDFNADSALVEAVATFRSTLKPTDSDLLTDVHWNNRTQADVAQKHGVTKMAISKRMKRIHKLAQIALASSANG